MGYDAFVICNCFQQGKTKEFPYKEFIRVEDEGIFLRLDPAAIQDNEKYRNIYREFWEWKKSACPHEYMRLVMEGISSSYGMEEFRRVVEEFNGEDRYPVLTRFLPIANGGTLPADHAKRALNELHNLEQERTDKEVIVLKEKRTGEIIQSTSVNYQHIFASSEYNKFNYGLDQEGFFIIENVEISWARLPKIVFRSKHFSQRQLDGTNYLFTDYLTHNEIIGTINIRAEEKEVPDQDFEFIVIRDRVTLGTEYNYMIESLKKLSYASIETGNPIVWT